MGSQTRLTMNLMDHYVISKDTAWELVPKFEAVEIGDELSDALFHIQEGHPDHGIKELYRLRKKLDEAIDALENALANVEPKE